MKKYKRALVWLRRDLRLDDNTALFEAAKASEEVALVFIFDINILALLDKKTDTRINFIHNSIREINNQLSSLGSAVIVKNADPEIEIPTLAKSLNAEAVFFNEDYEPTTKERDKNVARECFNKNIKTHHFKDHVLFSGDEVLNQAKLPYKVFSPYRKAWLKKISLEDYAEREGEVTYTKKEVLSSHLSFPSIKDLGFKSCNYHYDFQKPGSESGKKTLEAFLKRLDNYDLSRDFPRLEGGTSGLSVHLRFGTISLRRCIRACINQKTKGARIWLSELIWRDFYSMILDTHPYVVNSSFNKKYNDIGWAEDEKLLNAWETGMTGYPIVDAGMRQLVNTGWMHNRVRMIVASFFTKDLLLDWRYGEAFFAKHLLDYDLASNNGGWQWSASTGCDAQPYFRIFNPSLQSKRFDDKAEYIKHWLPELKDFSPKEIHSPETSLLSTKTNYPAPIVEHFIQKKKALSLFNNA